MSTNTQPQPARASLDAIDRLCINTLRTPTMGAVQQANSGHPGTPMAIPGLMVLRQGDAKEVAAAWRFSVQLRHEPVCLMLSGRNTPTLDRSRLSVEQARAFGWGRYARRIIDMQTFGAFAPLQELRKKFGFTPDAVAAAKEELAKAQ